MTYLLFFAGVGAFLLTALLLRILIPRLRAMRIGQHILTDGPIWHKGKEGTPTMGGAAFIAATLAVFSVTALLGMRFWEMDGAALARSVAALGYALLCGACGVADDLCKLLNKSNKGLRAWQKYLLLLIFTVLYLWVMSRYCGLDTVLYIPFLGLYADMGIGYWAFAAVLLTGTVNAVNLTDGVDGLCGSVSAALVAFFASVGIAAANAPMTLLSVALVGACMGFLVFNLHPAKVFMGDTGSLFLGGAISALAFAADSPAVLFTVGIVYMLEALSVILQVLCFRLTGKRIFRMAPLHHHLEKCGWGENAIVAAFTALTAVTAAVTFIFG